MDDLHRIGGGAIENLRLKPRERKLEPPGISLMRAGSPKEAAKQFLEAFPTARRLLALAKVIGSTNLRKLHAAGFDVIHDPSRKLPAHYRLIHPRGADGFTEENLRKLSAAFVDTKEQEA